MNAQLCLWYLVLPVLAACGNSSNASGVQLDSGAADDAQIAGQDVADVLGVADAVDADPYPCGPGYHHCACGMGDTDCVPDNEADADSVDGLAGSEIGDAGCVPGTVRYDMENLCPDGQTWVFAECTAAGTWAWQACPGPDASQQDTTDAGVSDSKAADVGADVDAKSDALTVDVLAVDAEFSDVPPDVGSPQMCTVPANDKCSDTSLSCQCCPAGGPMNHCMCAESCTTSGDCKDPARPDCKVGPGTTSGFCAPTAFVCCWACA